MTKRYVWVIITYIIMQFSVFIFAPILYSVFPMTEFQAVIYWNIISFFIGLMIILLLMRPDMKISSEKNATNLRGIVLWSVFGVFLAWFTQAIAVIIEEQVFGISLGSENTALIMKVTRITPIFMLIPAIIAPILEEIIFRKIIFTKLYHRTNFFIAALLSSVIFGIIHGEPEHLLIYGSMGFVFAYLYVRTRRIIVPIIVHMTLNSISVLVQYSLDPEDLEKLQIKMIFFGG